MLGEQASSARAMRRAGNAGRQHGGSRQGRWRLDEVADAEICHVRDRFGAVEVTEFGSRFLAGVHAGDSRISGPTWTPPLVPMPKSAKSQQ